jgi:hypothetical protein
VAALVVLVPLVVLAGVVVLVVHLVAALRGGPAPAAPAVALAARRHETFVSVVAVLASAGATVAFLMLPSLPLSPAGGPRSAGYALGAATAPYVGAVVLCLVRAVGERTWPRPRGAVRTAPLTRRTVVRTGGWRLVVLVATLGTGFVAVLLYGATATPDGQRVAHTVVQHDGLVTWGARGPYPGWYYGGPIAVGLAAVAVAALLALRILTRRPPLPLVTAEHDDAVRRLAAARLLAGAQLWAGAGVGLMMLFAALALGGTPVAAAGSGLAGATVLIGSMVVAGTAVAPRGAPRPHPLPLDGVAA